MNDVADSHPGRAALEAFALGHGAVAERDAVERHVAACAACCAVLRRVPDDALLTALRDVGTATAHQADTAPPRPPGVPAALHGHPRYEVLAALGAGGMGQVFQARHRRMNRLVALKVIRGEWADSPELVQRFHQEVQALARLVHPNVVTAFDADQAGELHFLVMEYLTGESLAACVGRDGPLPLATACECARQAALGLAAAHARGLVHRDVKPQNLMRTPDGVVKILDFGIARLGPGAEGLTRPGAVLGTPAFLAPEQRIGAPTDFRTDLYGLGATLFFLLTGQPPTAGRPLRDLRPDVPPGLADLVARLLAEEPARRPASVAAVAEALTAWTAPRPARRRWPAALGLAAAVALGLAILFRPGAPPAGTAAVAPSSAAAGPELRRDARRFATGHEGLIWACGLTPQGDLAVSAGGRIYLDGKWEGAPDFTPRVWAVATGREVRRLEGQVETVYTLAIAPDGRRVAAAGHDRAVRVWDLTTGELLGACLGHAAPVYQVAFAPDGRHLYSGGTDRTVRRWDAATFQEVDRLDCRGEVRSFALTPDGKDLIAGVNTDAGHALQWWTVSPAQQRHGDLPVRHTNEIRGVAVSPDGHWVLSGSTDTTIRLWDLAARAELRCLQGHGRLVKAVAFLPDGRHAVSASFDHTARLWDLTTGRECLRLEGTAKPVTCLAVARDGTAVLCGGFDKVLRLWPVPRWD